MNSTTRTRLLRVPTAAASVLACSAGVMLAQVGMAAAASAAEPNSIGDRVWHDVDYDGVQDSWEPGVAGIQVSLHDSEGFEIDRTISDDSGSYSFNNLAPGEYTVGFEGLGEKGAAFTTQYIGDDPELDSDADPISGRSGVVTVRAGGAGITAVDAGLTMEGGPAPQYGSIGDFVWHDKNANGIQEEGEWGVGGIAVALYDANGRYLKRDITDADGFYSFADLDYGSYTIQVAPPYEGWAYTAPTRGSDRARDSDINPATGRSAAIVIDAATRDNTSIDIGMVVQQSPPRR